MATTLKLYRIKHAVTGLYQKGGSSWGKKGKTWTGLGPLKNHLNVLRDRAGNLPEDAQNWLLIEIEVVEAEKDARPVLDFCPNPDPDKPLKKGSWHCPKDLERLHFETMGSMRLRRLGEDGKEYYEARCPTCHTHYKVEAP